MQNRAFHWLLFYKTFDYTSPFSVWYVEQTLSKLAPSEQPENPLFLSLEISFFFFHQKGKRIVRRFNAGVTSPQLLTIRYNDDGYFFEYLLTRGNKNKECFSLHDCCQSYTYMSVMSQSSTTGSFFFFSICLIQTL